MANKRLLKYKLIGSIVIALVFSFFVFLAFQLNSKSETNGNMSYIFSYVLVFGFVVWYTFSYFRIYDGKLKIIAVLMFSLCFIWILLKHLMDLSDSITFSRYCWYLYFLPIIFICYLFFVMCTQIFSKSFAFKYIIYLLLGLTSLLLVGLVLTNDLHHLVFTFDKGYKNFLTNSVRQPLYYIIVIYSLSMLIASMAQFLIGTFRRNTLNQFLLPFIILLSILTYSILYVMRVSFIVRYDFLSDVSFIYNLFFILLFESFMMNGLIQNNGQYISNFNDCILPLKIVDNSDKLVFVNEKFDDISYINKDNDSKVFNEKDIVGGKVIIEEDISKLKKLYDKLNRHINELVKGNEILLKRKDIKEEEAMLKARSELYKEIEIAVSKKSKEISFLVSILPDDITNANKKYAINIISKIRLRIGYLKQKCLLILQTKSNRMIQNDEFRLTTKVICTDIKNVGFDSIFSVIKGKKEVPIEFALAFNELMEYVGENFGFKHCVAFVTCNVDDLRCNVKVECYDKNLKLPILPSEVTAFGYVVSKEMLDNEYSFTMKVGGNNGTSL